MVIPISECPRIFSKIVTSVPDKMDRVANVWRQIVEVDGAPQTQVLANVVMGFSDGTEMGTWFSGARKDPVVVWMALPAGLEKFENFLTHRQSTFGVLGFSTHDQDGTVEEVEVRIRHSKDFIWPHSLAEHDYRDALEGLGCKCQIVELLYERQDVNVWNILRERLHFPGGVDGDEFVIDRPCSGSS